jgi:LysR family transcriptional activator of glutamate synthase operon
MAVFHSAENVAPPVGLPTDDPGKLKAPRLDTGPTLNRLHCFEVVVEEAGFKRATARLHITQPALSYQIKQLEDELGVLLFYRRPGGVTPTEAGQLLYKHVQRVSAAVQHAQHAIKQLAEGHAGEIRIGTVNSVGIHFLPQLLISMRERYPATRPSVLYRLSGEVIEALLTNQLDVAILAEPPVDHRLRYETLFEERVSLIVGRSHPLFGVTTVGARLLRNLQFVSLSAQTPTGALVAAHLNRAGIAAEPIVSTENVETVKRMVQLGMGVAFLPDMVTERDVVRPDNPEGRLGRCALEPALVRRIVLVTWDERPSSPAVVAFIEELRRQSAAWKASGQRG